MKFQNPKNGAAIAGALAGLLACSLSVTAQTNVSTQTPAATEAAASPVKPSQLPYGVADVLKLAHAKIGDNTIIAFVQSSRSQYGLGASEILYLKDQGVSEPVIAAMLRNGKNSAPTTAAPAAVSTVTDNPPAPATYAPPAQTYVQNVPAQAPASTVYVIRNLPPTYVYSDYYYPAYNGCYGAFFPPVSFSFGWGGGFRGHGFPHGGVHGGGSFGHHR